MASTRPEAAEAVTWLMSLLSTLRAKQRPIPGGGTLMAYAQSLNVKEWNPSCCSRPDASSFTCSLAATALWASDLTWGLPSATRSVMAASLGSGAAASVLFRQRRTKMTQ